MINLLKMNEATALALHTVELLARNPDRRLSTQEIATRLSVSDNHLSKVHQRLAKAGIVQGTRGPGGGFILAREADQISLMEVFESIEGPFRPNRCLLGRPQCVRESCVMGSMTDKVNAMVEEFLTNTTAAHLAAA